MVLDWVGVWAQERQSQEILYYVRLCSRIEESSCFPSQIVDIQSADQFSQPNPGTQFARFPFQMYELFPTELLDLWSNRLSRLLGLNPAFSTLHLKSHTYSPSSTLLSI